MSVPIPPGVFDILPDQPRDKWQGSYIWNYIESVMRQTAKDFGFQEIRTPAFERTELFSRGVGETSDIVSKEMYTFIDKGGRSMSLRPEGTAPVMRAFVENQLQQSKQIHKLFYIGPMFRYERAQAGRYRQHHQFGVEIIGDASPEQDVEAIDLLYTLYNRLGLHNLKVNINSIGDSESRASFKTALKEYLNQFYDQLSEDSKVRFEKNPLRILDSKNPEDIKITAGAPSIYDHLNDECRAHFEAVKRLLNQLKIPYEVNSKLVRGLDYYNKTVFEITAGELGAQNSVGGGGRYDGLLKTLGGPDLPSIGFGTGIERIIQTMIGQQIALPEVPRPVLYIIPLGEEAKPTCFDLLHELRQMGIATEMDFTGKKLNKLMTYANQIKAKYVAVIGENELKAGTIELKEMESGAKIMAPLNGLARILKIESLSDDFMEVSTFMSQPFQSDAEAQFFINKLGSTIKATAKVSENLQNALKNMETLL